MITFDKRYGYTIELPEYMQNFISSLDDDSQDDLFDRIRDVYPFEEVDSDCIEVGYVESMDEEILYEGEPWTPPAEVKVIEGKILDAIRKFADEIYGGEESPFSRVNKEEVGV